MERQHPISQVKPRPAEAGPVAILRREKLTNAAGKTLTVQIAELPPGGKVAEHHHGGPTLDFVLSGTVRMRLKGGPDLVYQAGDTFFEPENSVHFSTVNLSNTEPARIMLIHVTDDDAQLTVFH
jgi:quercetin dioxygenase-like cupin family protein